MCRVLVGARISTGHPPDPSDPQRRPSHQSRTRSARNVFRRLGYPSPSSNANESQPPVGVLQQPSAVRLPLVADQLDGAIIRRVARPAEVAQATQHVIVPARRPGELQPPLGRHLPGGPAPEQLPDQQVLLPAAAGRGHRHRSPRQLVVEQTLQHPDRRVERGHPRAVLGLAVPAAVAELLGEQATPSTCSEMKVDVATGGVPGAAVAQRPAAGHPRQEHLRHAQAEPAPTGGVEGLKGPPGTRHGGSTAVHPFATPSRAQRIVDRRPPLHHRRVAR